MESKKIQPISKYVLQRLPYYLQCLKSREGREMYVSAPILAAELQLNEVQVRKDLAAVSSTGGRPKTGYRVSTLITDIEEFLGYHDISSAVLVGVGHLGQALLSYQGFSDYGLSIEAAFDRNPELDRAIVSGKTVFPMEKLVSLCQRLKVHIGIITVPAGAAQEVCDMLVEGGVKAIWNFAPTHLNVPDSIILQNENMASSFAVLSRKLQEKL